MAGPYSMYSISCNKSLPQLLCITGNGSIYLWDINSRKQLLNVKLDHISNLLTNGIDHIELTDIGQIVLILSNGIAFVYDNAMECWMRIADDNYINSEYFSALLKSWGKECEQLQRYQMYSNETIESEVRISSSQIDVQSITISHLENQICCCQVLESKIEYKTWLLNYIRKLSSEKKEEKLSEIMEELIPQQTDKWNPNILGHSKLSILQEILEIITINPNLQKLTTKFKEILNTQNNEIN